MSSKCLLHVLNGVLTVVSLGLVAASIWFFVEVKTVTNLRNSNHYQLDYNVYWPQAIPWMFLIVGIVTVCVACFGFSGVKKRNHGLLTVYTVLLGATVLLLIAAAIISLVFADNSATDKFISDTIWDAYFQSKTERDVETSFGTLEKRLHCCGAESPRDYKNWKNEFPMSCCDTYYHGWIGSYNIDCDFTNKLANERYGCSTVAAQYTRIAIKSLSAVSIFIAFIGIIALIAAVIMSKNLRQKARVPPSESGESKRVLL